MRLILGGDQICLFARCSSSNPEMSLDGLFVAGGGDGVFAGSSPIWLVVAVAVEMWMSALSI
jgi:hypothetical protein